MHSLIMCIANFHNNFKVQELSIRLITDQEKSLYHFMATEVLHVENASDIMFVLFLVCIISVDEQVIFILGVKLSVTWYWCILHITIHTSTYL
jgi:hypothetical protein